MEKSVIVTSAQNTVTAKIIWQSRLVTVRFWRFSVMLDVVRNEWMEGAGITEQ